MRQRLSPDFSLGDHVTIVPLEDCPGRVIALELDRDGWTIVVRYFQNGEAKTLKAFPDEVVHRESLAPEGSTASNSDDQRPRIVRILMDRWEEHGIKRSDPAALSAAAISALEEWQRRAGGTEGGR